MCTVSFVNTGSSLVFTSNRDEKKNRDKAVFPAVLKSDGKKMFFPKDQKASGTWFVADDKGNVAILLNGAFRKHENKPFYKKSRGVILLDLFKNENISEAFHQYDFSEIEPFQLLVYSQKKLMRLLWDGKERHEILLNMHESHLLSSSTLYRDEMVNFRKKSFAEFQEEHIVTPESVLDFHTTHQIEKEESIQPEIKEKYITVSITQLVITKESTMFFYNDLLENIKQTKEIETGVII
ncbi:hypothetical protein D3C71_36640 [compost metagenome]